MTRVSFSTALASLLVLCEAGDAFAVSRGQKLHSNGNVASAERQHKYSAADHYASTMPSIDIGGTLITHGWVSLQNDYYRTKGIQRGDFPSEYSRKYGFASDGMLHITAEGRNDVWGVSYGGSLELDVPHVQKNAYVSFKQVGSRGARVFVNTQFGDLKVGYQEGVDSLMKVDAFSIGAGDNSNIWMRYVNLRGIHDPLKNSDADAVDLPNELRKRYLENTFYLSTGLYSQSILEGSNRFSTGVSSSSNRGLPANIVNALPFRFSYLSPSFGGLRLGVSYSPFGYDEDKIINAHVPRKLSVQTQTPVSGLLGLGLGFLRGTLEENVVVQEQNARARHILPLYERVTNVAVTYSAQIKGVDFKVSAISEYAKSKKGLLSEHLSFAKLDDMKNIAFGGMFGYKNLKLAASYGYLGPIDRVNNMYVWDGGKFVLNIRDKVLIKTEGTYFWTLGGGYEYNGAYVSAIYRGSNYSGNKLNEIALGAEYNISTSASRVDCSFFANYHYFNARSSVVLDSAKTNGVNNGRVMLAGMKVKF
ncbi:hypothetical protein AOV_02770 [Anaplasma ovis str. Haibei]|uniref:Porin domain-containing protein n=2 Tax=cellular organisms TaxID=131567 RepID=A0A6A6JZB4_HEVBR|nr:porin [Anaplasma ovis]ASI47756.1 hypothetical protein AOV_02770 [Anaplasma ovis str. Haibei]KAF2281940.1 hypothetical protein GH714_042764 [Hevea brasiliensis]